MDNKPNKYIELEGDTGTNITSGYLREEHIEGLQGMEWAFKADEMRRSDEIVAGMHGSIKNTILGASWAFIPRSQSDKSREIADACKYAFFESMSRSWTEILEEYCSIALYGYYISNPITHITEIPGKGKVWAFKDFSWRSPKTIEKWEGDEYGCLKRVYQRTEGDQRVNKWLEADKLFYLAINKEGSNFEGISAFRAAYPGYYRKKLMHKIKLVGVERAALGFPDIEIPTDWKEGSDEYVAIKNMLKNLTSNRSAYSIRPAGSKLTMLQIPFDAEKLENVINSESTNMTYCILADFLMLGRQGGGNRMLGDSKRKTFLQSISYLAWYFIENFNKKYVKQFIEWNYGNVAKEDMADLSVSGIEQKAILEFSATIKNFVDGGLIKPDISLESMLRDGLDLPPVSKERIEAETDKEQDKAENITDAPVDKVDDKEDIEIEEGNEHIDINDKDVMGEAVPQVAQERRPMTKYESKCNFADIEQDLRNISEDFNYAQKNALNNMLEKYIIDLRKRVKDGANIFNVIADLEMTGAKELEKVITENIKKAVLSGAIQVEKEIESKAVFAAEDKLPAGVFAWVRKNAKRITENKVNDLTKKIDGAASINASIYPLTKKLSGDETSVVINAAKQSGLEYIDNINNLDGSSIVPVALNLGRKEMAMASEVIGFQYSAIIDSVTTYICRQLDQQMRGVDDYDSAQYDPPNHFNCRSILVPITALETEPEGGFLGFSISGNAARDSKTFKEVK